LLLALGAGRDGKGPRVGSGEGSDVGLGSGNWDGDDVASGGV
jgi:hypothetical protein